MSPPRIELPDSFPAWTFISADVDDRLWLERGGPWLLDNSRGEIWAEWTEAEGLRREVVFPPGVEILRIREGHAVGTRYDEFGTIYLVFMRVPEG